MANSIKSNTDDKDDAETSSASSSAYESELDESDSDNDEKSPVIEKYDSSDEEDLRNTIGNIPVSWYDGYDHLGYNWDGRKLGKGANKTEIEDFLAKMDDPNYWRTIRDKQTGKDVVLPDKVVSTLQNIKSGRYPSVGYNPYQPFLDLYSHEVMDHPINNEQDHKRSFLPSKLEAKKVSKLVHAIKMGWIKPKPPKKDDDEEVPKFYDLWEEKDEGPLSKSQAARRKMNIPAPKMKLPGHAESYNPPPEYLFNEDEKFKWEQQESDERKIDFIPQQFDCFRRIPQYSNFIKERFSRCMDLYLAPRKRKMKLNVQAEDLLPKLPEPKDLRPFPTSLSLVYYGHTSAVRSISVEPRGQYFASVSDDPEIRIWEISTGRCLRVVSLPKLDPGENAEDDRVLKAHSVAWCPNQKISLLAVAVNCTIYLLNANVGDRLTVSETDSTIRTVTSSNESSFEEHSDLVNWKILDDEFSKLNGLKISLQHSKEIRQISWHSNGDYFATVCPDAGHKSVLVHQLSKAKSQALFSKQKGVAQCALFHPTRPYFFVANQRNVRIYNLTTQQLVKKIMSNCKSISSLALHPQGDNLIIGSNDCRLDWVDLDLSTKPYKSFSKHHKAAVRSVCFHKHFPMFASSSSDGTAVVSHGMVYSDWSQNPLIVPLKILRPGKRVDLLDCAFHPIQPWLFASGSDGHIRLFT